MRCYPGSQWKFGSSALTDIWPDQLVLSSSCMQARLKSLYSTHRKMQRKGVPVTSVYDVRALRVIVSDAGRRLLPDAVEACYAILPVVHRLWRQVLREADDYIANPTPSGYQSLHTAVTGEPACTVWTSILCLSIRAAPVPTLELCRRHLQQGCRKALSTHSPACGREWQRLSAGV